MNRRELRRNANVKMRCDICGIKCKAKTLRREKVKGNGANGNPIMCKRCWDAAIKRRKGLI